MTFHKAILGDSLHMIELANQSIDCIVTSPPYNVGIPYPNYNDKRPYPDYRNFLKASLTECTRVVKLGGHLCVVIGDVVNIKDPDNRSFLIPTHALIHQFLFDTEKWSPVGEILWNKVQNVHASGGGTLLGSYPYPPNPWIRTYEHILIFRRRGQTAAHRIPTPEQKEQSKLTLTEWKEWVTHIWTTPGVKAGMAKFAAFPEEIPRRLIRMYSFVGDTILDPFYGTGTTGRVAMQLGRNSIGYEIDESVIQFWKDGMTSLTGTLEISRRE